MVQLKQLTIFLIFMGFASILFIFLSEIFHLQRISQRFVSIKAETESTRYWKSKVLPMLYENIILSIGLLISIYYIRPIWKSIRNQYLFSYVFLNIHQLAIKLPAILYQHYFVDVSFGVYTASSGKFFIDLILHYIINNLLFTAFVIPTILIGNRLAPPTTQKIMIEDNQDQIADSDPKLENLADVDLQELEEIEPDPEEHVESSQTAFRTSPLWIYLGGILISLYILSYILYPTYYKLFHTIYKPTPYIDQKSLGNQFQNFTFPMKDKRNESIYIIPNDIDNFYRLELMGTIFPKKVISSNILSKSVPEELRAGAVYLDSLIDNQANLVGFFIGLLRPLLFIIIFKAVDAAGIKEFHIRPGKTVPCVLLVSFAFYNTVMIYAEPLIASVPRYFQKIADCTSVRSGYPMNVIISRIDRANFATVTHHPIFSLVFVKTASPEERFANIDVCLKSGKPKLM